MCWRLGPMLSLSTYRVADVVHHKFGFFFILECLARDFAVSAIVAKDLKDSHRSVNVHFRAAWSFGAFFGGDVGLTRRLHVAVDAASVANVDSPG